MKLHNLLPLLLVPLLTACPEMDELNKSLSGTTSSSATVTSKHHSEGDCRYVRFEVCTPEEFGLYYSNNTNAAVTKSTYDSTRIGDSK